MAFVRLITSIQPSSLLCLSIITYFLYRWWRLSHIPGPRLASLSHLWIAGHLIRGDSVDAMTKLTAYGPLARIGPNYVLTSDPEDLDRMSRARSPYNRHEWYLGGKFDPEHDNILTILDKNGHDAHKKRLADGFGGRDGVNIEETVNHMVLQIVAAVRKRYLAKEVDLNVLIRNFTLDVISRLCCGEEFGFITASEDLSSFSESAEKTAWLFCLFVDIPILRWLAVSQYSILAKWLRPRATDRAGFRRAMGIARDIIAERYKLGSRDTCDMIGFFMRHGLSQKQTEAETVVQLFAGTDTIATAIRSTLLYIITTPRVVRQAIQSGQVSDPITLEESRRLPYFQQAVLYEGLRMRPPPINGQFKKVPPQGDILHGTSLHPGTAAGINYIGMLRCKQTFGEDVELFRPERFTDVSWEQRRSMEYVVETCFSRGRWMCPGKLLAFTEMNKIYFEFMRHFEFRVKYPGKPWEKESLALLQRNIIVHIRDDESAQC
ncbi:cytochrome P450 [Microdochium trichocladiopsis]|uniref:Cytochrome P450 n=1 Tax=Microdochium trichocladiopsis TaxID=1682393 RepID=A0A9P9BIH5_9PEZI|nr:cytochrome P450 [Microdochium trichocladiopsis]KAH7012167.1 cytochrome P450 [Microdochium trichocladiopsis]